MRTEAEVTEEKIKCGNYMPLADYFMLFMLTYGREYKVEMHGRVDNKILENPDVWEWNDDLKNWGYMDEITINGDTSIISSLRLTDKAMALIKERAKQ